VSRGNEVGDWQALKMRLCRVKCRTCIYRRGNKMHLDPGRAETMAREALALHSYVVCHATLRETAPAGVDPAICRGFYDLYRHEAVALVLIAVMFGFIEVDPPKEDDYG
jgi:hypothetical protein